MFLLSRSFRYGRGLCAISPETAVDQRKPVLDERLSSRENVIDLVYYGDMPRYRVFALRCY